MPLEASPWPSSNDKRRLRFIPAIVAVLFKGSLALGCLLDLAEKQFLETPSILFDLFNNSISMEINIWFSQSIFLRGCPLALSTF